MQSINPENLWLEIKESLENNGSNTVETFNNIISQMLNNLNDDEIDKEEVKKLSLEIFELITSIIKPTKNIELTKMLNHYELVFENETINIFQELISLNKNYLGLINIFLFIVAIHKEAIKPKIKYFKDGLENNNIEANRFGLNIYKEFEKDSLGLILALQILDINLIKDIDKSTIDTLNNQKEFLNSHEKIEDYHIFKSIQLYAIQLVKNTHFTDNQITQYVNTIINDIFKDTLFESNLTNSHIKKTIQYKCQFYDLPLLEFQTATNKKIFPLFN